MSLASADLPSDPDTLRAFALACQSELAAATAELQAARLAVQLRTLEIEKLKFQIAKLRRMQFGRSSERVTRQIEHLDLRLEELEAGEAAAISQAASEDQPLPIRQRSQPKRKKLPDHLPRQEVVHEAEHDGARTCPACGGDMAKLGEDVTEVLDYIPGRFRVIRHVRPKYACRYCDAITQAPGPALPMPRGRAAPGMLAHLLVSKFADHLPLYRQSQIYARDGLDLDRSTLSDWVGQAVWLLQPIVEGIRQHVFAAEKIHGDDTPIPVLEPGLGRTRTGRLWVYVRDDRPFCGPAPPAAAYFYLRGKPLAELVHPEQVAEALEQHQQLIQGAISHFTLKTRYLRKDGLPVWVNVISSLAHSDEGAPACCISIVEDISERVLAKERREGDEAKYRAIIDAAVDSIVVIDDRGIIQSFNGAAEHTFGYQSAEVVGENVRMLMPQPYRDAHDDYIANYITTGHAKS
jgi:transposase